jgi:hypothetical protein
LGDFRRRVKLKQFSTGEPHGFQCRDLFFGNGVGNFFRLELLVEIGADAEPVDSLNVFRRRSKTGATQKMKDLLLWSERRAHRDSFVGHY